MQPRIATVPKAENTLLSSWKPWIYAGAVANKLAAPEFEADDPFWPVYYSSSIALLDTIRDTLRKKDSANFPKSKIAFQGFEQMLKSGHPKETDSGLPHLFWSFVHKERNSFLHNYDTLTTTRTMSTRPFLWDGDATEVKTGTGLTFGEDGDSPLRLIGLSHSWFEEILRVLDQAVYLELEQNPFENRTL